MADNLLDEMDLNELEYALAMTWDLFENVSCSQEVMRKLITMARVGLVAKKHIEGNPDDLSINGLAALFILAELVRLLDRGSAATDMLRQARELLGASA